MKTTVTLLLTCLMLQFTTAQGKLSTKSGVIDFEASVPSFEPVAATNSNVSAILNTANGEFASLALINGFRFDIALMEEHFNENYMESGTYPKAIFKGVIQDFNVAELSSSESTHTLTGEMTMHGVSKTFTTKVYLKKLDGTLHMKTNFVLKPGDFDIEIPKIVANKIADEVNVSASYELN